MINHVSGSLTELGDVMSNYESPRDPVVESDEESQGRRLSYKFQRLRERIRSAIETGELNGKLPGERVLARRFKVNAKTLSKALTDLAAEGLLERNIGLGTFVRGSSIPTRTAHRCLALHDPGQSNCPILRALMETGDVQIQLQEISDDLPPSLVNPFRSVLICSRTISDDLLKDLVVRGKNVIQLDRSVSNLTTHAVMIDRLTAVADLARRLMRAGHHNLMLIGAERPTDLQKELVSLLPSSISLRSGVMDDVRMAMDYNVTALICTSAETAAHVMAMLTGMGIDVPGQISVVGTGRIDQKEIPSSGQYVSVDEVVQAVRQILSGSAPHRPVSLWLSGQFMEARTISPVESMDRFGG
jgi:DNA-binding HxlR family transcriptional regulator